MARHLKAACMSLGLITLLAGCGAGQPPAADSGMFEVRGELTYRERIALPEDSVAVVELQDVSAADAPAVVIADRQIELEGRQVPVPFTLTVERSKLVAGRSYSVRGTIARPEGQVLWTTVEEHPVDVNAESVELGALMLGNSVIPASASQTAGNAPGSVFTASGNEPGWRLNITDVQIVLLTNYNNTRIVAPGVAPEIAGGVRRYVSSHNERPLVVTITQAACADSMSGMPYPYTVTVSFDNQELRGCGGEPVQLLQGSEWVVESIDGAGVAGDARATLNFAADGSVSGRSLCNTYRGSYALTGESLSFSLIASTLMACAPELMEREKLFTDLLAEIRRFEITESGALILHAGDGRTITARRQ